VLGQPGLLGGGEGLEVELASGGAGGLQDGGFEVVDGEVATGLVTVADTETARGAVCKRGSANSAVWLSLNLFHPQLTINQH
jgi:hypothetical protein